MTLSLNYLSYNSLDFIEISYLRILGNVFHLVIGHMPDWAGIRLGLASMGSLDRMSQRFP